METSRENIVNGRATNAADKPGIGTCKITWGSIIAGAVVSLICAAMLNFLGVGLGLTTLTPNETSLLQLGAGAVIWLIIAGILSALVCGWFAGKFANTSCRFEKGCHGLVSWSLAMILTIAITTVGAGALLGGAISVTNHTSSTTSARISQMADEGISSSTNLAYSEESRPNNYTKAVEDASGKLGGSALIIFVALLLGALASILGAFYSGPNNRQRFTS